MGKKLYPFSARKHAHDIELVANRAYNLAQDALDENRFEDYERLMARHYEAEEVSLAIMNGMQGWSGVSMLDGPTIGKAKEMVLIAASIRDEGRWTK